MYVCIYIYMNIYIYVFIYMRICICMYMYMYMYMYIYIYVYINKHIYIYVYICIYICIYLSIYLSIYLYRIIVSIHDWYAWNQPTSIWKECLCITTASELGRLGKLGLPHGITWVQRPRIFEEFFWLVASTSSHFPGRNSPIGVKIPETTFFQPSTR